MMRHSELNSRDEINAVFVGASGCYTGAGYA